MLRTEIHNLLNSFTPVGLNEMDEVKLMNRVETKYLFSANKLHDLLIQLPVNYKILEIDSLRDFPYHTTYLDTPDHMFFTQQVRGKLNRYKLRYRRYESSLTSFLEVKKKTNKKRTKKWRIEKYLSTMDTDIEVSDFLRRYLPSDFHDLQPVLINRFYRITLVGKEIKERITLDFDLSFSGVGGITSELPFLGVAELKRERFNSKSPFAEIMKRAGIHSNSFSKYCIGIALTDNSLRKNILKPKLLLINKIENEYTKSA
jgi:hypothetical protein